MIESNRQLSESVGAGEEREERPQETMQGELAETGANTAVADGNDLSAIGNGNYGAYHMVLDLADSFSGFSGPDAAGFDAQFGFGGNHVAMPWNPFALYHQIPPGEVSF